MAAPNVVRELQRKARDGRTAWRFEDSSASREGQAVRLDRGCPPEDRIAIVPEAGDCRLSRRKEYEDAPYHDDQSMRTRRA